MPNEAEALELFHQAEMRLFGFASSKGASGQGLVQVTIRQSGLKEWAGHKNKPPAGIIYLLGQGLYESGNQRENKPFKFLRKAIDCGNFSLTLILHHPKLGFLPEQDRVQVLEALKAFGLLGNLGSRQNRGFGSVRMTKLDKQDFAQDKESYENALRDLFKQSSQSISTLPAFCKEARMRLVAADSNNEIRVIVRNEESGGVRSTKSENKSIGKGNAEWQMLSCVGEEFLVDRSSGYKSDGKRKTLGGFVAQCFYEDDHAWITNAKKILKTNFEKAAVLKNSNPPVRIIYGLPYGFAKSKEISVKLPGAGKEKDSKDGRRASPLHIHITKLVTNSGIRPAAILYTLPSIFLPEKSALLINLGEDYPHPLEIPIERTKFNYAEIDNFLNRFTTAIDIFKTKP